MDECASSPEKLDIRIGKPDEQFTGEELKIFKKILRKLNWLASNTRPDLAVYVMNIGRRQKKAALRDFRDLNRIIKKVEQD